MRLFTLLLLFPFAGFSQTDSILRYSSIVEVTGQNKEQLFSKARQWVTDKFKDAKQVIQISDLQTGEIAGGGNFDATYYYKNFGNDDPRIANYQFRFGIYVKDGRYKFEFYDVRVSNNSPTTLDGLLMTTSIKCPRKVLLTSQDKADRMWRTMQEGVRSTMILLADDLLKTMIQEKAKTDF